MSSQPKRRAPANTRLASTAVACLIAALFIFLGGRAAAATTWLVSFTIDAESGVNVTADAPLPYTDYRIDTTPHPSPCVEASPSPTGSLHAVFNRQIDSVGTRCRQGGSERQFRIAIGGLGACTRLFDAYGPTAVTEPADGTCELFYNDDPRVRVAKLWAKGTRTPVAFLTRMDGPQYPISYEIRTETDATITPITPNSRLVTYMGKARLLEFRPGKTEFVEAAFDLKHKMTFTREAQ